MLQRDLPTSLTPRMEAQRQSPMIAPRLLHSVERKVALTLVRYSLRQRPL